MEAQGSDKKELLRLVPLLERKFQSSERKCVVHLLQREMAYDEKMSQEMEIVSNLRPIVFWLKVRTRGPQPSICVRTLSLFTSSIGMTVYGLPLGKTTVSSALAQKLCSREYVCSQGPDLDWNWP